MERWNDSFLDTMRLVGDPPADSVIHTVFETGSASAVNAIMQTIVNNDDLPTEDFPLPVREFLAQTAELPAWADHRLMIAGSRVFNRHGPEIVQILFAASLPLLYASHPGNRVLTSTTRMTHALQRRIVETGQFLIDVTDETAWSGNGRGIRTTQKVRLMHAAIRHFLAHDTRWADYWQTEWFVPICQEDLAATMLSFSVTVIQCLEKSNIYLTSAEKEAYLHLWKVIGHLLGIDDTLMPHDYPDAVRLMDKWMSRTHRDMDAARQLMGAMLIFWEEQIPGRIFDRLAAGWCRVWIGNDLADMMGVPPHNWTYLIMQLIRLVWWTGDKLGDDSPLLQFFTRHWSRHLIRTLIDSKRDGNRIDFHIPDDLQAQWGI